MKIDLREKIANRLSSGWPILQQRSNGQVWPDRSIAYYTGATSNSWTPESLQTGIGGSEMAIIHLAKAWVKLGYQVSVYCV